MGLTKGPSFLAASGGQSVGNGFGGWAELLRKCFDRGQDGGFLLFPLLLPDFCLELRVRLKLQQTSWIMSGLEDGGHGLRTVQQKD